MMCTNCGKRLKSHENYCADCGTRTIDFQNIALTFTQNEFCSECGAKGNANAIHCHQCGTNLFKITSKPSETPIMSKVFSTTKLPPNLNLSDVKTNSLSFLKLHWQMFLPIIIGFVLILVAASFVKDAIESSEAGELITSLIQEIEEEGSYYLDRNINIDNPINIPMITALMHGAEASILLKSDFFDTLEASGDNVLTKLLILPIIILIVVGLAYGYLVERNDWPFWQGIFVSVILYALFIVITSWIANDEIIVRDVISFKVSYGLFDSFLSSVILAAIFFTVGGLLGKNGLNVLEGLSHEHRFTKFFIAIFIITFIGFILSNINASTALERTLFVDERDEDVALAKQIIDLPAAATFWNLAQLNAVYVKFEDGETEKFNWLTNNMDEGEFFPVFDRKTQQGAIPSFLLILLPIVCLIALVYWKTHWFVENWQPLVLFAVFYAIFQCALNYMLFPSITLNFEGYGDRETYTAGAMLFTSFLRFVMYALIIAGATVYVKRFMLLKGKSTN